MFVFLTILFSEFSGKRIYFRTFAVLSILAACEIFPLFGPIVDLIGGSLNVFLCFIFPVLFYLKLYPETTLGPKFLMGFTCVTSCIGAVSATTFNIINMKESFYKLYSAENTTVHP